MLSHKFSPDIGGIETNSEIFASSFLDAGHEIHVLTWTKDPGNKIFPFPVIRDPNIFMLFKEHLWADIVFENNPCIRLAWPNLFVNRPSVISLNTWISKTGDTTSLQHLFKKVWISRATKVISVSDAVRRACWPNATVIGNPYRSNIFNRLVSVRKTLTFVALGRLVSQKGFDLALLAFHQLLNHLIVNDASDVKISLTIIGDGPERGNLESLVKHLELTEYVRFTGTLSGHSLANCLSLHRFLIVPSLFDEAFGNVVLEGMACGNLPIVSDSGGLPEAVGNSGLVFPQGDFHALESCMRQILENPLLDLKLRNNAARHLAQHQPQKVSRRYLDIIESAV